MALKPCPTLFLCSACRGVFTPDADSARMSDLCPTCGSLAWQIYLDPSGIIGNCEDAEVLAYLVDHCDDKLVRDIARILGFHGGNCRDVRTDNRHMKAFREFIREREEEGTA